MAARWVIEQQGWVEVSSTTVHVLVEYPTRANHYPWCLESLWVTQIYRGGYTYADTRDAVICTVSERCNCTSKQAREGHYQNSELG